MIYHDITQYRSACELWQHERLEFDKEETARIANLENRLHSFVWCWI